MLFPSTIQCCKMSSIPVESHRKTSTSRHVGQREPRVVHRSRVPPPLVQKDTCSNIIITGEYTTALRIDTSHVRYVVRLERRQSAYLGTLKNLDLDQRGQLHISVVTLELHTKLELDSTVGDVFVVVEVETENAHRQPRALMNLKVLALLFGDVVLNDRTSPTGQRVTGSLTTLVHCPLRQGVSFSPSQRSSSSSFPPRRRRL